VSKNIHQITSRTETEALNPPVSQSKETTCKFVEVPFNVKIFSLNQFCSEFEDDVMTYTPQ